jgi:hypothetical protein
MRECCKDCRYCITAIMRDTGKKTDAWCRMKGREAPKNPCKFWRPKALGGAQK